MSPDSPLVYRLLLLSSAAVWAAVLAAALYATDGAAGSATQAVRAVAGDVADAARGVMARPKETLCKAAPRTCATLLGEAAAAKARWW